VIADDKRRDASLITDELLLEMYKIVVCMYSNLFYPDRDLLLARKAFDRIYLNHPLAIGYMMDVVSAAHKEASHDHLVD
jgi:hypothetical protein